MDSSNELNVPTVGTRPYIDNDGVGANNPQALRPTNALWVRHFHFDEGYMRLVEYQRSPYWKLFGLAILLAIAAPLRAQTAQPAPFKDYPSFVNWMQKNHKAPFNGVVIPHSGSKSLQATQMRTAAFDNGNDAAPAKAFQNVKVNQDRNPWPKAGTASAVDPSNAKNWVVMSNDFRENLNHLFYHVSTDRGKTWTDDALVGGADPNIGYIPLTFQVNPGLSFDDDGNSCLSVLSGNEIEDFNNNYLNLDSEIDEVQGFAHGTYSDIYPTLIDAQSCSGTFGAAFVCDGTLSQPQNSTDANSGSPNAGTNYVYYTFFCNLPSTSCTDGTATIPPFGSVILESHASSSEAGYSAPALVSGSHANAQFSNMVIDPSGTPHIFFDEFTNTPQIQMWESTLVGGVWTVSKNSVARFVYNGLGNPNWAFSDSGAAAPGCGIHDYTAYCAFSANQAGGGAFAATPSVYLVSVDLKTGNSRIARVNADRPNDLKDHFFAWATATPNGDVYVGWYDDRNDPSNTNVQYFVGKSTDGARTFPIQKAVNDVPFNPCTGFPGCGYFGDYTQLASGPDGVVHAAWNDTRDGVSMQLWSQTILF
jgi:hypothetical protein